MAKIAARIIGSIFILIGILGFIPENPIISTIGFFHANIGHNILHIILGIILIIATKTTRSALLWLRIVGGAYLMIALLGFILIANTTSESILGIIDINQADNWLHTALGVLLLLLSFIGYTKFRGNNSKSDRGERTF